ncbi:MULTISPECIES: ABC transporter substrate-binding protein [unclassified Oceanobacillus]|uniref:ABC transporter substrate-binding protein n=1 Tax=unclassified Oceanobacillus TaxID=2630292 RepID=UPI00300DE1CB
MKRNLFIVSSILYIAIFLIGCGSTDGTKTDEAEDANKVETAEDKNTQDFPVTIEHDGEEITINEKPENILPLSLDVTEILLELVDPSRVVAISSSVEDEHLSTNTEKAEEIPNRVSTAAYIDPEEVLAYETDLLLLTKMHGQEEDASSILSEIDLPIITFETMGTLAQFMENIEVIGQAVGETEKAAELIEQMENDLAAIQSKIPEDQDAPSVLVLSEVGAGTGPFMMGPGNISYDLIQLAGATPAVDKIGLEGSTPASIEQVMKMDPDYIFLLDFFGNGEEDFTELSENPGWSSLQAIENDRVKLLDVKYLMNPNVEVIEGLEIMVDWIYGLE